MRTLCPLVTIVTPSYNSAATIEQTLKSVQLQEYPNIEHIIIDGGSTDGTLDILRRYPQVRWISEPDHGQADALNKGFRLAQGEIIGWLNADDMYLPGSIISVVDYFERWPEVDFIHGEVDYIDLNGTVLYTSPGQEFILLQALQENPINQPAAFFRRNVFERVGFLREDLHYVFDYEFWLRLGRVVENRHVPERWAQFRLCAGTKTVEYPERFWLEKLKVFVQIFADPTIPLQIREKQDLIMGRMHWLAGTCCYRAGRREEAIKNCHEALEINNLLAHDYPFAISCCRYIEGHEFRKPADCDWIDQLIEDLPSRFRKDKRFINKIRGQFYATRAYYEAYRSHWSAVRLSSMRALRFDFYTWICNRGFLKQALASVFGPQWISLKSRISYG